MGNTVRKKSEKEKAAHTCKLTRADQHHKNSRHPPHEDTEMKLAHHLRIVGWRNSLALLNPSSFERGSTPEPGPPRRDSVGRCRGGCKGEIDMDRGVGVGTSLWVDRTGRGDRQIS